MGYVKKITGAEFAKNAINEEMRIVGGPVFEKYEDMVAWQKEHREWFTEWSFKTKEQFLEWKNWFYEHYYDWQPKHIRKSEMHRDFNMFCFNYGLKFDFEYEYHDLYDR